MKNEFPRWGRDEVKAKGDGLEFRLPDHEGLFLIDLHEIFPDLYKAPEDPSPGPPRPMAPEFLPEIFHEIGSQTGFPSPKPLDIDNGGPVEFPPGFRNPPMAHISAPVEEMIVD